jgi:putative ABC transport system permease protein
MTAAPVARAVRGGLSRRRVQTVVIGLVVLVSTAATVLALALVVLSNAPFERAFAAQRGAHVAVTVEVSKVTYAVLAGTARLPDVTAAAGPFAEVTVTPRAAGATMAPMTLVGRAAAGGPVDDITVLAGGWATRTGQVVLDAGTDGGPQIGMPLGTRLTLASLPGAPTLTVVGIATSVTDSAAGWVAPAEIARLHMPGPPASTQMLYRFRSAGSAAVVRADVAAVAGSLPRGAIIGTESYLAVKAQETGNIAAFAPFLIAFGLIGIVMSVLIVANVVSGAVISGYRRIGILKSIGFTPGQVAAAYAGQVTVPALAGCAAGVALGNVLAVPLLARTATVYGVGSLRVPVWVDVVVPAAICSLAAVAALGPASRAGRLSAVHVIATGRAPRAGRGYRAQRLLGRLPLPRPVSIGLAAPFARPGRTWLTLAAVLLGATAVTFAAGLTSSLRLIVAGLSHASAQPVQVYLPGGGPGAGGAVTPGARVQRAASPDAAQHAITAALDTQPGTLRFVAEAQETVTVPGLSEQVPVTVFRGKAAWTGYDLVSGRWYGGRDEVDVPTGLLTATGQAVGDTITFLLDGRQIRARIAGEIFDTRNRGINMITDWRTVTAADPTFRPERYDVALRPGTDAAAYTQALSQRLGPNYLVDTNRRTSDVVDAMIALIATLTTLLALVAGLGVLNTVILSTSDRVHDLGIFKAVGMTPRQIITMIVCTVAGIGLVGGLLAVPAGVSLHHYILPAMASAAGLTLPPPFLDVYTAPELLGLALAGAVIAIAGSLLPASWAANTQTASALHAE